MLSTTPQVAHWAGPPPEVTGCCDCSEVPGALEPRGAVWVGVDTHPGGLGGSLWAPVWGENVCWVR